MFLMKDRSGRVVQQEYMSHIYLEETLIVNLSGSPQHYTYEQINIKAP